MADEKKVDESVVSEVFASLGNISEDVKGLSEAKSDDEVLARAGNILKYVDTVKKLRASLGDELDPKMSNVFDLLEELTGAIGDLTKENAA